MGLMQATWPTPALQADWPPALDLQAVFPPPPTWLAIWSKVTSPGTHIWDDSLIWDDSETWED